MTVTLLARFLDPTTLCPCPIIGGPPAPSRFESVIAAADEVVLVDFDRAHPSVQMALLRLCAKAGKTPRREETGA